MSVAGGVSNAVERAVLHGCEALQIFSKNARQLRGKPLDPADVRTFRRRVGETGITPVVSHASYLILYLWPPMLPDSGDDLVLETAVNRRAAVVVTFIARRIEDHRPVHGDGRVNCGTRTFPDWID
jgi:hypothetical protein